MNITDVINLDRYPIDDPQSGKRQVLIRTCRDEIQASGLCELPAFLSQAAVRTAASQAASLSTLAHPSHSLASAYLSGPTTEYPNNHARNHLMHSAVRVLAYDNIPAVHLLRQVYEWPPLLDFVAQVLGLPRVFHYADPLGALNVAFMGDGDQLAWHFDQTDFVLSIPVVAAGSGGDFEVVPMIRSDDHENYDEISAILAGKEGQITKVAMQAGSLLLFKGRHSLHRVTPIHGTPDRIVALLAYDSREGVDSTPELKLARYGRTA